MTKKLIELGTPCWGTGCFLLLLLRPLSNVRPSAMCGRAYNLLNETTESCRAEDFSYTSRAEQF